MNEMEVRKRNTVNGRKEKKEHNKRKKQNTMNGTKGIRLMKKRE